MRISDEITYFLKIMNNFIFNQKIKNQIKIKNFTFEIVYSGVFSIIYKSRFKSQYFIQNRYVKANFSKKPAKKIFSVMAGKLNFIKTNSKLIFPSLH